MGKSAPQAPAAPDPTTVDQAQATANDQTAQYQQQLNMINTTGPTGSVSYIPSSAPGGYTQQTTLSPSQQGLYNSTTQAEQGALNVGNQQLGNVAAALNQNVTPGAMQTGVSTSGITSGYGSGGNLQYGYDPGGSVQSGLGQQAPIQSGYSSPGQIQSNAGYSGQIAGGYGSGGQIQGQVYGSGANPGAVNNAAQAAYNQATQYLTPQYQQSNEQLQSQLAAQGLNPNDAAYQNAVTLQNNAQNQGYQGAINNAISAGDAEQNTLYGQNLSSGQFANAAQSQANTQNANQATFQNTAQQQAYTQNMGNAQLANSAQLQGNTEAANQAAFYNQAQNQSYTQALGAGNFANSAQAQQNAENLSQANLNNAAQSTANTENQNQATFQNTAQAQQNAEALSNANLSNSAEQQLFQQQAYGQSLPINELSSLLGLSQVSQPTGISYSPTSVGSTNALGAYQLQSGVQENNYNQAMSQQNDLLGGLFGLGSSALGSNAGQAGLTSLFSDARLKEDIQRVGTLDNGLPVYRYRYKGGDAHHIGVMAQEALDVRPDAVSRSPDGFLMVDYAKVTR